MSLLKSAIRSTRLISVVAGALVLASCANKNPLVVTVSHCPAVVVVGDVGTLTRLAGSNQNIDDVVFSASILNVNISCTEGDSVNADVTFEVAANAGAALKSRTQKVEYFAAVLKDNSQLVTKKYFDVTLNFDSNGRAVVTQSLSQVIPTIDQARRYDYELLLGFKMTPSEIAFNMEQER